MALEELYRDPGNAVGLLDGRVLVQVRWGEITVAGVEAIGRIAERATAVLGPHARFGALLIQEPTAAVPDGAARDAQRRVIRQLITTHENARIAGVVMGSDLGARLRLTVVRMLTVGDERFRHHSVVEDASAWLSAEMGGAPTPDALRAAVLALRR